MRYFKPVTVIACALIAVAGCYLLSVVVRVSVAENKQYGRSTLIPLCLNPRPYSEPATSRSFGDATYTFVRSDGKQIEVYKQLINGFQHAYGSALVDYELGTHVADWLFRANEYAESYIFSRNTDTEKYSLDTRKDLANNIVGRQIGKEARRGHLSGRPAYEFILAQCVDATDSGRVLPHFFDARVAKLPTEAQLGCPGLRANR